MATKAKPKAKPKAKREVVRPEEIPPDCLWLASGRFRIYAVAPDFYEIWHNPKPRRVAQVPNKKVGVSYHRPGMKGPKKWGTVIYKKCPRIVGYFENDSEIGYWMEDNFAKIK